jgi:hypothetical protein
LALHTELEALFSKQTIRDSEKLEPQTVDALAVKEAAGAFLRLKGQPGAQVDMVNSMPPSTAAALCRWLTDPAFWCVVGGITKH